jgi:hypothetical protein
LNHTSTAPCKSSASTIATNFEQPSSPELQRP